MHVQTILPFHLLHLKKQIPQQIQERQYHFQEPSRQLIRRLEPTQLHQYHQSQFINEFQKIIIFIYISIYLYIYFV